MSAITLPRTTFPIYEHKVRSKLDDLISRVFSAPFAKVFSSPIASPGAVAVIPWYLSGGIAAANCLGAYAGKGAASFAASKSNLVTPGTYDLTDLPKGPCTWDVANGWSGFVAGTSDSKGLNTGINNPLAQTYSAIARFTSGGTAGDTVLGAFTSSYSFGLLLQAGRSALVAGYWNGNNNADKAPTLAAGTMAIAGANGFRNGINESITIPGGTSGTPSTIYIGGYHVGLTLTSPFSGYIQAVAIYNTVLLDAQISALHTAMAAL